MLFSSCLEVLVSGYSFYVWAWSRLNVMRMGVFVSLVSQNLQGSYLWGWASVSFSITAGVHNDLITPPSYFVFIFVPFWGWSLRSWDRWASRLSAVGCKETISVDTWSVSVSSLSPQSDLHLRSEWSMQAGKAWGSSLVWSIGWGLRHQRGSSGGPWYWPFFSKSLSEHSEHACTLQFHCKNTD